MLKPDLLIVSADLDGIWDELGSLLLGHTGHIFQQDSDLKRGERITVCMLHCVFLCAILLSHQAPERIYIYKQTSALKGLLISLQVRH